MVRRGGWMVRREGWTVRVDGEGGRDEEIYNRWGKITVAFP